jgi:glucose/arabinose dehydrogenase
MLLTSSAAVADDIALPEAFEASDIGDNNFLGKPTNVEFAPDGRVFVLDEDYDPTPSSVKVRLPGSSQYKKLFEIPHVNIKQDRGIVGMALDKDFESNGYMYLLYTYENVGPAQRNSDDARTQRLTRVTVPDTVPASPTVPAETVLLGSVGTPVSAEQACPYPKTETGEFDPNVSWGAPYATTDCIAADSNEHAVDSVVVDPVDGTLWVSIGDGAEGGDAPDAIAFRSQSPDSLNGKLLHIDRNGKGLPTNGTCPGITDFDRNCTKVYARGFRNPYQFSFRPDGKIVVGDVGWKTREEVDLLSTGGKNYGWPCYEGTQQTPLWKDRPECIAFYGSPHETPIYEYPYPAGLFSAALIMGPTYVGTGQAGDYPDEYKGAVFFNDHISTDVSYMKLSGGFPATGYPKPFGKLPSAVSWDLAPNGDLVYVDIGFAGIGSDSSPAIRQISAVDNHRPTAVIDIDGPPYGPIPFEPDLDGSGSTDPDPGETELLEYRWDLDGDGDLDDSTVAHPVVEPYTTPENVTVTLEVTDPNGKSDTETMLLYPGNLPPTAPAMATGNPSVYRGGQQVGLSASTSDPDSGDTADLHWAVVINHAGTHTHDLDTGTGDHFAFTTDTVHDQPSTYEVTVYAEDERELRSAPVELTLHPDTRQLHLASVPSGATVNHGGVDHIAPHTGRSTIGVTVGVSAGATVFASGLTHMFNSWSNGGPRSQTFAMPAGDLTLTARYGTVLGPPAPPAPPAPPSPSPRSPTAPQDARPPRLAFNVRRGINAKRGRLTGIVADPSGVRRVDVALRRAKRARGKCLWWSRKAKRVRSRATRCGRPAFMRAKLRRSRGRTRWILALRKRLPRGRYVVVFRTMDRAGNVGRGRPPVRFVVRR